MAGFLICLFVATLLEVALGWHAVVGGLVGLGLGALLAERGEREQRIR